jgi:lipopolysaccharide/colanic/teichoic acid biosynthesis glycosyltransferase
MKTGSHVAEVLPVWKRVVDIACCVVALPLLGLMGLLVGLIMKVTSPGPILFRQDRVGYRGRRFSLFKFRTMRACADASVHQEHCWQAMKSHAPMRKLDAGDDRLIPGAWLWRAVGLDELPQIINVLRGEMSIVGPRPCIPSEYEEYTLAQRARLDCVPGLTGLWQVSGKNRTTFERMVQLDIDYARRRSLALDRTTFERMVQLDIDYARRRSLALDLQIILRTLPALWAQVSDTKRVRDAVKRQARDESPIKSASLAPFANTAT